MKRSLIIIVIITFFSAIITVIFITSVYSGVFGHLQSKEELLGYKNATASVVLSQEGELIGKIFSENRTNISYRQIPTHLINALIATEDARFFEHEGIDSRSLFRVLIKTILFNNRSAGGGSTITQQLAKNMFGRKKSGFFSVFLTKIKEALLAHRLEKVFTKEEILTLYLNTVSFDENVFGIEAASLRYFNKKVELLNIEESAVLVGILKANNFYNPRLHPENAKSRRNVVLNQMKKYNYLESSLADSLCKLPLVQNYANLESAGPADYFLYHVKNEAKQILQNIETATAKKWNIEEDGLIITTTLNLTLQNYVNNSFHDHLALMQKRLNEQYESVSGKKFIAEMAENELKKLKLTERANEVSLRQIFDWNGSFTDSISVTDSLKHTIMLLHAGLLAVNPVTGAVKAYVGGIDFKTHPFDQILASRQMASAFKPILYAEALEEGIKPCYYLDNDSIVLSGFEDWSPENFDHSSGGKYSLTGALINSMNIPTFNLFLDVGFSRLDSMWRKMGFSFPLKNTPSLAMGIAEASIKEVVIAYSSFANGGYKITPQKIVSIKTADGEVLWQNEFDEVKTRILSERTTLLISAILQKAVREGTGVQSGTVYGVTLPLAGKTGTSQDYADAWFAAFNPSLVLVSRVGATSPSVHFNNGSDGSGSALALPLVAMTLKKIEMNRELMEQLITPFPELTPELAAELDCPDFREKKMFENIIDIFKRKKIPYDKETSRGEQKKKPFFKRIFGTKNTVSGPIQPSG
jgi:penicillin-binding protein 1A